MSEPTNEKGLVTAIRRALDREWPNHYLLNTAGNPYQASGTPDLLVCVDGNFIGMEVKFVRPGESRSHAYTRVSPQQWKALSRIQAAGGVAEPILSVDDALRLVAATVGAGRTNDSSDG